MLKEFREFIMRGNVMDMAVGIIIGAAFSAIVNSLVKDIIMPPIGLIWNKDFTNLFWVLKEGPDIGGPYETLADAQAAGAVTMNYGSFINYVITFLIVAFAIFMLIRWVNRLRRATEKPKEAAAPTTKDCPFCLSAVPIKATRCPHCTSELKAG
ncbi:MAG: large-conductance mechanosensitive channel protein MscL [Dehalococcoidia bacterium]|nr:large-conductance mechanosensitive channel protein MscL [Dehalococcoidia bacterium]